MDGSKGPPPRTFPVTVLWPSWTLPWTVVATGWLMVAFPELVAKSTSKAASEGNRRRTCRNPV